jgi:hypothetical protein
MRSTVTCGPIWRWHRRRWRSRPAVEHEEEGAVTDPKTIDGILVQWGDRLFYPGNRTVHPRHEPGLRGATTAERAARLRERIAATLVRRAPQVMVKVTGGGRGMKAIAAHFRYIGKHGRLELEDEQGNVLRGKDAVRELADDWRHGGSLIGDEGSRREAFNIILSMPRGTDPMAVQRAARAFAQLELADHKYVMVLHDHQANPHVHLSVRAESKDGRRLNPRKADLHRWRETFAERLRELGIDAEASRQPTRGASRSHPALWQVKAAEDGRLMKPKLGHLGGTAAAATRRYASEAWARIGQALASSADADDRKLAETIRGFSQEQRVIADPFGRQGGRSR